MPPQRCRKPWKEVIELLKLKKVIKTERVANAMLAVDRYNYCKRFPYHDEAQDLGFKSWICAPHVHAFILELLSPKLISGSKVLDIGSGSGYLTACMGIMVGSTGLSVGVEHIKELAEKSLVNIREGNPKLLKKPTVRIYYGDGRAGITKHAPYDVIYIGAAGNFPPKAVLDQLKIGGRLVMPIGTNKSQKLQVFDKISVEVYRKVATAFVRYSALTDKSKQWPWNTSKSYIANDVYTRKKEIDL